jgi:hypothetical protein
MKRIAVLLLAAPALFAENSALGYLPEGTRNVIGINVRAVASSALVKSAMSQAMSARPDLGAQFQKLGALPGFDPLRDIEEVLIGAAGEGKNAPAVVVLRGHFDVEKMGAGAFPYRGVPMLSAGGGASGTLALIDGSIALAGDAASVRAAIDRGGKGTLPASTAARIESLRSRYDIWGFGHMPSSLLSGTAKPDALKSIDSFQFGIGLSNGLEGTAELHARSPEDAQKLSAIAQMVQMMVAAQKPKDNAVKLSAAVENRTLKVAFQMPQEELEKAMAAQGAALRGAFADAAGRAVSAPAGAPAATAVAPSGRQSRTVDTSGNFNPGGGTGAFTLPSK